MSKLNSVYNSMANLVIYSFLIVSQNWVTFLGMHISKQNWGQETEGSFGSDWKWLWKMKFSQRIIVFLRLWRHEKILTNRECLKRGISSGDLCKNCLSQEDNFHIFRDRTASRRNMFGTKLTQILWETQVLSSCRYIRDQYGWKR